MTKPKVDQYWREKQSFIMCKEFVETLSIIRYEFMANLYLCYVEKILYHGRFTHVFYVNLYLNIFRKLHVRRSLRLLCRQSRQGSYIYSPVTYRI